MYILRSPAHFVDEDGNIRPISMKPANVKSNILVNEDGSYDYKNCPPLADKKLASCYSIYGYNPLNYGKNIK